MVAAPVPRKKAVAVSQGSNSGSKPSIGSSKPAVRSPLHEQPLGSQMQHALQKSMSKLDVKDQPVSHKSLNEQAKTNIHRAGLLDDENTLMSSSTNANSFDGKSTASGTTFNLDGTESLRPDDSASVQAVDDDELGSCPLSAASNSRIGSEAGSRAFRAQFSEISANIPAGPARMHPSVQVINTNILDDSVPIQAPDRAPAAGPSVETQDSGPARPLMPFVFNTQPDEKLFEALDSPKDRMFLLRLEQNMIDFIQNKR